MISEYKYYKENLEDMLQNGTCINKVMIEKPHKFITACTIAKFVK